MNLFRTPMLEVSRQQELIECLIIFGAVFLILLTGQVIYQIERRRGLDRDNRRSEAGGVGNRFHKAHKNEKYRQELGKNRKRRNIDR